MDLSKGDEEINNNKYFQLLMSRHTGGYIQNTAMYLQPGLEMTKTLPATLLASSPLQQIVCYPVMMTQIYLVSVSVSFAIYK